MLGAGIFVFFVFEVGIVLVLVLVLGGCFEKRMVVVGGCILWRWFGQSGRRTVFILFPDNAIVFDFVVTYYFSMTVLVDCRQ
jgi:hypothetical protein